MGQAICMMPLILALPSLARHTQGYANDCQTKAIKQIQR